MYEIQKIFQGQSCDCGDNTLFISRPISLISNIRVSLFVFHFYLDEDCGGEGRVIYIFIDVDISYTSLISNSFQTAPLEPKYISSNRYSYG